MNQIEYHVVESKITAAEIKRPVEAVDTKKVRSLQRFTGSICYCCVPPAGLRISAV